MLWTWNVVFQAAGHHAKHLPLDHGKQLTDEIQRLVFVFCTTEIDCAWELGTITGFGSGSCTARHRGLNPFFNSR